MLDAKDFSRRDKFGAYNGMQVVSVEKGRAVATLEIKDHHRNGLGTVHGGALFTLADLAFAAASNCADEMVVSINAVMSFSKACTDGVLAAEAVEVARSAKLVHYEARVRDAKGDIVAIFNGTGYIKGPAALARQK